MSLYARPTTFDPQAGSNPARPLRRLLEGAILTLLRWQELAGQRRALAALSDDMLKDLGLTRADALSEAGRPFWDEGGLPWRLWR